MRGRIAVGLLLISLGIALGLQRMGVIAGRDVQYILPLFLIALGVGRMWAPRCGRGSGVWLILIGTFWLLSRLHVLLFTQLWPLLLVVAGVMMIAGHFLRRPAENGAAQ